MVRYTSYFKIHLFCTLLNKDSPLIQHAFDYWVLSVHTFEVRKHIKGLIFFLLAFKNYRLTALVLFYKLSLFFFHIMTQSHRFLKTKQISVIGVPFNGGQPRKGVEEGPARLVEAGILNQIEELGYTVAHEANNDLEDLRPTQDPDTLGLKQPKFVSAVTKRTAKQIQDSANKGNFVLTLGGDHSIALGTVSGVFGAYPDACLVWVDAHGVSFFLKKKERLSANQITSTGYQYTIYY
jgi:hypothetical protein